jgi:SAM-dependent methyltransferase
MEANMIKTEYVQCLLCHEDSTVKLGTVKDTFCGKAGKFNLVQCRNCGLAYLNPRPSGESIGYYYPDYQEGRTFDMMKKLRGCEGVGKLIVKDRLKFLEKKFNLNSSIKVLDVGCGLGSFLALLREKKGCQIYGVDFDQMACQYLEGIEGLHVKCGELVDVHYEDNFFDVITLFAYLEHSFDPIKDLKEVYRILKPDGIISINVPNFDNLMKKFFKEIWFIHGAPQHLYHFNASSLQMVLDRAGFQPFSPPYYPITALEVISNVLLLVVPGDNLIDFFLSKSYPLKIILLSLFGLGSLFDFPLSLFLAMIHKSSRLAIFAKKKEE